MPETPERLALRLRSEGKKTLDYFNSLAPEDWGKTVYSDGGQWTVRQLLAHYVGSEAGMYDLIRTILGGGSGAPDDFDLDSYNQRRVERMADASLEDLMSQFTERRDASVRLVESLRVEDLQRMGRHPWLGVVPVEEIIQMLYRHNQIHQRDIRKVISVE